MSFAKEYDGVVSSVSGHISKWGEYKRLDWLKSDLPIIYNIYTHYLQLRMKTHRLRILGILSGWAEDDNVINSDTGDHNNDDDDDDGEDDDEDDDDDDDGDEVEKRR